MTDKEAIWRPDVTVATIVERDGRFLLVEERIRDEVLLNQPAGHLEPDESLAQAAVRETIEETGWTVELTDFIGIYQWTSPRDGSHFVRLTFAANAVQHNPNRRLDSGILRAVWLTRDEIAAAATRLRSPMVLSNVDDWISGRRLPLWAITYLAPEPA